MSRRSVIMFMLDLLAVWYDIVRYLSIIFTVYVDPLNYAQKQHPGGLTVIACDERYNRAVNWFYRNYPTPDIGDWDEFCAEFKLPRYPEHLLMAGGKIAFVAISATSVAINDKVIELGPETLLPKKILKTA